MRLALYEPDIPQNVGTILRLADCMNVAVDIIEPCGFIWSDPHLKRAGMDYLNRVEIERHTSWNNFFATHKNRLVLLSTKASLQHINFVFEPNDILLCGNESSGVPQPVHDAADTKIKIPMSRDSRSLNVAISMAIVLSEALRQTNKFPDDQ